MEHRYEQGFADGRSGLDPRHPLDHVYMDGWVAGVTS